MESALTRVPRVTVIAQCYNHERFVVACLDAIDRQTYSDFRLIVIDDCSTDSSPALIERWLASRRPDATFLRLDTNVGVTKALNQAMRLATGEFVIAVATDDVWEPTLLEKYVERLDAEGESFAAVFANASCIDEAGEPLDGDFFSMCGVAGPFGNDLFVELSKQNFIPASAIMLRRSVVGRVGEYDESLAYEDWDMWLRIAEHYLFTCIAERLSRYRIVRGSLVRTLFAESGPTPDALATHCQLAVKQLRSSRRDQGARTLWRERLVDGATLLYEIADPRAARLLRRAFREPHAWRARTGVLALAATLGVPSHRLFSAARRVKATVFRR